MPELANDCRDMTNSSSTYFSILIGAIIGALISWWIYNRQKKTSELQDATLVKIKELNERHDDVLKRIQQIEQHHQATLEAILKLEKRLEHLLKNGQNKS
jgi:gas vesicle protein